MNTSTPVLPTDRVEPREDGLFKIFRSIELTLPTGQKVTATMATVSEAADAIPAYTNEVHKETWVQWFTEEAFAFRFRTGNRLHKSRVSIGFCVETGQICPAWQQRRGNSWATAVGLWTAEMDEKSADKSGSWGKTV